MSTLNLYLAIAFRQVSKIHMHKGNRIYRQTHVLWIQFVLWTTLWGILYSAHINRLYTTLCVNRLLYSKIELAYIAVNTFRPILHQYRLSMHADGVSYHWDREGLGSQLYRLAVHRVELAHMMIMLLTYLYIHRKILVAQNVVFVVHCISLILMILYI